MPSTFTYTRPRGVQGVYIVRIALDLLPSERAVVDVGRYRDRGYSCGSCGHQHPINPLETQRQSGYEHNDGNILIYEIGNMWERDVLTIEIHDTSVGDGPFQLVQYTATRQGILATPLPCTLHGRRWDYLEFNQIALIDADKNAPTKSRSEKGIVRVRHGFEVRGLQGIPVSQTDSCNDLPLEISSQRSPKKLNFRLN